MKTIKFNAAPHHTFSGVDPEDGRKVKLAGGETDEVSDGYAEELATAPYADVSIVDESGEKVEEEPQPEPDELQRRSRAELNALADQAGVPNPALLATKDDVIAAIRETEEEPEAAEGEGHDNDETNTEED